VARYNTHRARRPLTNIEVIERVARFLRTRDVRHLPPALRGEAEGIAAMCAAALATGNKPWPAGAARPEPRPDASVGELVRALAGDERANASGGLFEDGA
jgi:hypothetical protein